jgi:hypothetical protein
MTQKIFHYEPSKESTPQEFFETLQRILSSSTSYRINQNEYRVGELHLKQADKERIAGTTNCLRTEIRGNSKKRTTFSVRPYNAVLTYSEGDVRKEGSVKISGSNLKKIKTLKDLLENTVGIPLQEYKVS